MCPQSNREKKRLKVPERQFSSCREDFDFIKKEKKCEIWIKIKEEKNDVNKLIRIKANLQLSIPKEKNKTHNNTKSTKRHTQKRINRFESQKTLLES